MDVVRVDCVSILTSLVFMVCGVVCIVTTELCSLSLSYIAARHPPPGAVQQATRSGEKARAECPDSGGSPHQALPACVLTEQTARNSQLYMTPRTPQPGHGRTDTESCATDTSHATRAALLTDITQLLGWLRITFYGL